MSPSTRSAATPSASWASNPPRCQRRRRPAAPLRARRRPGLHHGIPSHCVSGSRRFRRPRREGLQCPHPALRQEHRLGRPQGSRTGPLRSTETPMNFIDLTLHGEKSAIASVRTDTIVQLQHFYPARKDTRLDPSADSKVAYTSRSAARSSASGALAWARAHSNSTASMRAWSTSGSRTTAISTPWRSKSERSCGAYLRKKRLPKKGLPATLRQLVGNLPHPLAS